jgi:hypothetical protein
VFALATPKSPTDRGGRWQLQHNLYCNRFYFSVLLSDIHQGRMWNQTTQPELVAKPWQRRELNPRPLGVVGKCTCIGSCLGALDGHNLAACPMWRAQLVSCHKTLSEWHSLCQAVSGVVVPPCKCAESISHRKGKVLACCLGVCI